METKFAIKLKSKEHKDNPYVIIKEKDVYNYIHTTLRPLTSDDIKNKIDTTEKNKVKISKKKWEKFREKYSKYSVKLCYRPLILKKTALVAIALLYFLN